jgi:hypothetical protein
MEFEGLHARSQEKPVSGVSRAEDTILKKNKLNRGGRIFARNSAFS